jgi:superfamily I DNA/RNA helicase
VLAIDEAQDSSAIVDRICRRLASSPSMERVLIVGDPYQSIFGFGGSDFRHFLSWDADEKIMPQSYRCPRNVMALGEQCIRQMRSGYRDRGIVPASHEGSILHADDANDAIRRINKDESTLILGRCGFSLLEYEASLAAAKIPYAWIDAASPTASLAGYKCLWDLEHGKIVHGDDWSHAIAILAVKHKVLGKLLIHGEKSAWKEGRRSNIDFIRPTPDDLVLAGCEQPLVELILSGRWGEAIDTKHAKKAASWRTCARAHGPELASSPKVRLSTIHSAKGMEGDTVILSTVSSYAVETARQSLAARWDEECRVNYVGVTRARQNLIVVGDGGKYRLELPL